MQVPVDEADFLPAHNDRGQKSSATTDVFEDTKRENPDPFFRGVSVTDLSSALRTPYTEAKDSTSFLQQLWEEAIAEYSRAARLSASEELWLLEPPAATYIHVQSLIIEWHKFRKLHKSNA